MRTNLLICFFGISELNLPFINLEGKLRNSYDLISWFNNYFKDETKKKNIAHDNKNLSERTINNMEIFYSNEPWFYIDGFLKNNYFYFSWIVSFYFVFNSNFF